MAKIRVRSLNPFSRPEHNTELLYEDGSIVGCFDFQWSSDLLFRPAQGEPLRSDSWNGLLAKIIAFYDQHKRPGVEA